MPVGIKETADTSCLLQTYRPQRTKEKGSLRELWSNQLRQWLEKDVANQFLEFDLTLPVNTTVVIQHSSRYPAEQSLYNTAVVIKYSSRYQAQQSLSNTAVVIQHNRKIPQ